MRRPSYKPAGWPVGMEDSKKETVEVDSHRDYGKDCAGIPCEELRAKKWERCTPGRSVAFEY